VREGEPLTSRSPATFGAVAVGSGVVLQQSVLEVLYDCRGPLQRCRMVSAGCWRQRAMGAAENASRRSGRRWLKELDNCSGALGWLDLLIGYAPQLLNTLQTVSRAPKLTPLLASRLQVAFAIAPGPPPSPHSQQSLPPNELDPRTILFADLDLRHQLPARPVALSIASLPAGRI